MTLAATDDTWGVAGPAFLLVYVLLAAAVWAVGTRTRRALADPQAKVFVGKIAARPHDVAYLNGGAELAVYSALSSMHLSGTVASSRGEVRATGHLDPGADELERAIHGTAGTSVHRKRLTLHRPVSGALQGIEQRLVGAGLLLSGEQRDRIRRVGFWMVAVAGLGLVRLLAGIADAKPVAFLAIALLGVTAVAVFQLVSAPRRTRLGDRTLAGLRDEHHGLSPTVRPDWTVYGPAGAALGVGLFGMGALWASDPAFAEQLAAQRVAAGGSDGGVVASGGDTGSSDGGGGGDGGCGGGGCGG